MSSRARPSLSVMPASAAVSKLPTAMASPSSGSLEQDVVRKEAEGKPEKRKQVEIRNLVRGNKKLALQIAGNEEMLDEAMVQYQRDWETAGDTSELNLRTWHEVHAEVNWRRFGMSAETPVLSLGPLKISVVGSVLKGGGYRSC